MLLIVEKIEKPPITIPINPTIIASSKKFFFIPVTMIFLVLCMVSVKKI